MTAISDEEVLEHFEEAFPSTIEAQSLERNDFDMTIGKPRVLILLFKSELP